MAFDYNRAQATALRLIGNFGTTGRLRRYYKYDFDPIEGTETTTTYQATACTLVTVPSGSGLGSFDDQFLGALAVGKARVFLVAASGLGFDPEPGDYIEYDEKLYEIGSTGSKGGVMPLNPAGTAVMFTCGAMLSGRDFYDGTEL